MATTEEKKLNKEQLEAVQHGEGPLLIIAGAGTGKTTVVTERIKYLISSGRAKPSEILALTFTDKAAREMEERVDIAMPYGYTQMWISTFHAFCDRVLRQEALQIGLDPRYNLLTQAETIQFLRQNLFKFDLQYFRPLGNPTKFLDGLIQHFSRLKDEDVSTEEYLRYANRKNLSDEEKEKTKELVKAYQIYEELKVKEGMMDFADLISNTLKLFRVRKNVLKEHQDKFKYILVDEFQDTNYSQNQLAMLLAGRKANITVTGDDDQSVYRFRGAAVSNIIQFRQNYPKAEIVVLTKNYRSSQEILDRSYQLIQNNNPDRLEVKEKINKKLVGMRGFKGDKIELFHLDRVENEAETVAFTIKNLISQDGKENLNYKDFAILVRANSHADAFVRALSRANIPYQFLGPGMLFKQAEVKDLIAYLKLLADIEDSVVMYRILAMDIFEIAARDLAAITSFAKRQNLSLFTACERIEKIFVSLKTRQTINKLVEMIHRHLSLIKKETAGQILYYFLEDSGLLQKITNYKTPVDERKAQNISKFFDKLKTYEVEHEDASVFAVADWLDLSFELGESPLANNLDWTEVEAVNILTVHSAKGLEFPVVFLVNLVNQRFPTNERREQIPIPEALIKEILPVGDYHLEEERRLFYVGMTRARDKLFLTAANYYGEGKRERKVSSFVFETLGEDAAVKQSVIKEEQLLLLEWKKTPEIQVAGSPFLIDRLSYSDIETFKECPLHYKLKCLLRIPTPPTSAQSFGSSLHAVLRDFYKDKIAGKRPGEKELLLLLRQDWINEGYTNRRHEELTYQKGEKFLRSFWQQVKNYPVLPLALEQFFVFPLGNIRVVGRLDRVDPLKDEKIEIIDYKTGANVPDQKKVDEDLQMTIYALAATQVRESPFGKKPEEVILSLYFFETGEKITTQRTAKQLEEAKKEILDWAEKISQSDFKCSASEACRRCEYRLLCEVG